MALLVSLEVHPKRTFAWALDWPGWCRSARTEEGALEALEACLPRYRVVAELAGRRLGPRAAAELEVVERLDGDATTAFGAPGAVGEEDRRPLTAAQAGRRADLVEAGWTLLSEVAAAAPAQLRRGPRGGGRDRDAIVAHVADAERAYPRKLGIRHPAAGPSPSEASAVLRAEIASVLRQARSGDAPERGWPPRYAARRIAWHAIDHAWEIQDRSETG